MKEIKRGMKNGIPIALGYLSVSFSFGAIAVSMGFSVMQSVLISLFNLTSAGQFASLGIIAGQGTYLEMAIVELTVNIRYAFMSLSLSQKVDEKFKGIYKWLLSFFITDEIFALSMLEENVSRTYFFGLASISTAGWMLGTTLGAMLGSIVPTVISNALSIALYAMFIAIIIPGMKKDKNIIKVVALAIIIRSGFYYLPIINQLSSGFAMTISALTSAFIGLCYLIRGKHMDKQFYIYLAIMSLITYAIRAIPLVFINKKITNPTIQSFLDYIPYTVLAAMTFPDIFYSTGHLISGIVATIIIIYASYKELSLIQVACIGCFVVVMIELIL